MLCNADETIGTGVDLRAMEHEVQEEFDNASVDEMHRLQHKLLYEVDLWNLQEATQLADVEHLHSERPICRTSVRHILISRTLPSPCRVELILANGVPDCWGIEVRSY